jgi:hypothetical protein
MAQDKALKRALQKQSLDKLPTDFNSRLMMQIHREAERKKKRSFIIGLCSVSAVSLLLISLAIYLLKDYLTFSFHIPALSPESRAIYGFCFYIAFLIVLLIGFDNYFRTIKQKRVDKSR